MKFLFFTLLYQPLYNFLIFLIWLTPGHSIAVSIVILTVVVRLILLPTSLKAARLQIRTMELQPKINKIRSEIKDQKEQSQALMNLYKEEGLSPFGSCLPLLIQLPLLIVLYQVFRNGLTAVNPAELYSFIPHTVTINNLMFGLDLAKADPWVLPILAGLSQLVLSLMMMPPKPKTTAGQADPMAMMSRQMIFLLPIMTVFIGRSMPAALIIYWIVTTVFSIGQQWYVNKEIRNTGTRDERRETENITINKPNSLASPQPKKQDMLMKMMNKRLDKQERKSGVNVTVRSKKK